MAYSRKIAVKNNELKDRFSQKNNGPGLRHFIGRNKCQHQVSNFRPWSRVRHGPISNYFSAVLWFLSLLRLSVYWLARRVTQIFTLHVNQRVYLTKFFRKRNRTQEHWTFIYSYLKR